MIVTATVLLVGLFPRLVKDVEFAAGQGCLGGLGGVALDVFKNVFWVQETWIDLVRLEIVLADIKYFCRLLTGCLGFEGGDLAKELLQDPQVGWTVPASVNFGDERPMFLEMLCGTLQGMHGQLGLFVGILVVRSTHIGGSVMQDDIDQAMFLLGVSMSGGSIDDGPLNVGLALFRGNVTDNGGHGILQTGHGSNRQNIDGDNLGAAACSSRDLRPSAGGGAQIQDDLGGGVQDGILTIDLTQFECGTTSQTLFFGHCILWAERYEKRK
jgi:hypothetical protein